ncbi:MAG: undecaprenyl-diphosphate phosphatase [Verrucomicrobiaceae bacterium]|nr:undecaprenyl-diphosphate phosphatase [Verrucomicrobiaceae bacterium]
MHPWSIAIILGLVEGLTEFIPVSSTGHLLIAEHWLGEQSQLFNVVIQPAAALALIPIFWTKITRMVFGMDAPEHRNMLLKLALAFGITVAGGVIMKKMEVTLPKTITPVAWATLIGGLVIIAVEALRRGERSTSGVTWTMAVAFGLAQLVAIAFPGASRSGTTIMFAMLLGLARPAATEFSFLLGIPTLFAAGAKEMLDVVKDGKVGSVDWVQLGLGALAAFISAFVVVKWLIRFVQTHNFNGFAIYRLVLGAGLLVLAAKGF